MVAGPVVNAHVDINIPYFFVKDRVANGEVHIEYCPTKEMWADYFTKPLQGTLFYKLHDQIMNIDSSSEYHSSHMSVLGSEDFSKVAMIANPETAESKENDVCQKKLSQESRSDLRETTQNRITYKQALVGIKVEKGAQWAHFFNDILDTFTS